MKVKYFIITLLLFSFFIYIKMYFPSKNNNKEDIKEMKEISMEIKEDTLTSEGLTLIITDENRLVEGYDIAFKIEKKEFENWEELKPITNDIVWTTERYVLNENNQVEIKQNWKHIYGSLSRGKYKLIKYITINKEQYSISLEFEI